MIKGLRELYARFEAIKPNPRLMRTLAVAAVAEQKRLVPRRTGNLGRSIHIGRVTDTSAETIASAEYAAFVELGTKGGKIIRPVRKKALRFAPGGSGRLSGSPRTGGAVVFAKWVKRGATRAQPYMRPGAERAVEKLSADVIVKSWNDAA